MSQEMMSTCCAPSICQGLDLDLLVHGRRKIAEEEGGSVGHLRVRIWVVQNRVASKFRGGAWGCCQDGSFLLVEVEDCG